MFKTVTTSLLLSVSLFASSVVSITAIEPVKKDIAITIEATGRVIAKDKTSIIMSPNVKTNPKFLFIPPLMLPQVTHF